MDVARLGQSPIGELVRIPVPPEGSLVSSSQYWAFAAAPLSYAPNLELATLNAAGRAAMAVARLDQAVSQLPNQDLLIRPIIRREATSTSALEGTYAEFDAVLEADFLAEPELTTEQREIGNVVRATEHAVRELASRPIGRRLIGELQAMIVRGTGGETYDSGDLRQRQVFIGPGGRPVEEARFVPCPPGDRLAEGFSDWEKWLNTADDVPIVVRLAMAHYQFETLHPYADGNGRLGRLILTLQLIDDGALRWPVLNISSWLEEHRVEYMNHLFEISCTGALDSWIRFFARGIQESSDTALQTINQLLDFRDRLLPALRRKGVRGSGLVIAENLLGYPVIDVRTAAALAGVTFQAANTGVARLVSLGILAEFTGRPINRIFWSRETLNLVNRRGSDSAIQLLERLEAD